MPVRSLRLAIVCAVCAVVPAWAHHSHGNYDLTAWTTMEGKVTEVHLLVPHSWIYLEVKNTGGAAQVWALEATSRPGLEKVGITRDTLKIGDRVKVRCHPLRDKSNGCLLGFLKAPDGSVKDWDGNNAPPPTDF